MSRVIERPIFVVGGARSGTTLLHDMLSAAPELWSAYREIHGPFEWEMALRPNVERGESNALDASHATPARVAQLHARLAEMIGNSEALGFPSDRHPTAGLWLRRGMRLANRVARRPVRAVFKNPKDCFRVPFLRAMFPDAQFVFLCRGPRGSVRSLLEGWRSRRYETYRMSGLGTAFEKWSFDLPPGWSSYRHAELAEICAHQFVGYYEGIFSGAAQLNPSSYVACRYEDLIARPYEEMARICAFLGVRLSGPAERMARAPRVVNAVTAPRADKWKDLPEVSTVAPIFDAMRVRLGYDAEDRPVTEGWLLR